jgi:hypothetical protein
MTIDTLVSRYLLTAVVGEDARFASAEQYEILRHPDRGWNIRHCPAAANPTFVNGFALDEAPRPLRSGDLISVGPERVKLQVRLEG